MDSLGHTLLFVLLTTAFVEVVPPPLFAQSKTREIDQHFIDERASNESLFKTLPGNHITPVNNRMIFTLMMNSMNAEVRGKSHDDQTEDDHLKVQSYSVAPYLALSGKYFGGGLSGEIGEGGSRYNSPSVGLKEQSLMRYHGLGVHMFYTPTEKTSRMRLTFAAGTRVLSVNHRARSEGITSKENSEAWEHQNYQVSRSQIGANLDLKLFKNFSLIPWVDHNYTYSNDLASKIDHQNQDERVQHSERYTGDNLIFWQPGSQWHYGLDAALRLDHFEFHFGNLVGAALNQGRGSNRIENRSFSLSVIFLTPTDT